MSSLTRFAPQPLVTPQPLGDDVTFERKVKEVEEVVFKALQAFPMDNFILDAEYRFCHVIKADPKAFESIKKAFAANKKSPYIASTLAKIYMNNGQVDEAIRVLKECLDVNPSSKDIHFSLAKYLIEYKPESLVDIIHHLRRSFTQGDIHYNAQFWFGRMLYLSGEVDEAGKVFRALGESKASLVLKKEYQAPVLESGKPKLFHGKVSKVEASHAFIIKDGTADKVFAYRFNNNSAHWSQIKPEKRVVFEIAFNYKGPVVLNLRLE